MFGPLLSLWDFFEMERYEAQGHFEKTQQHVDTGDIQDDENKLKEAETTLESANNVCGLLEMTVATIGQAFNALSYDRRRNVLMNIVPDKKKVKDILSENTEALNENHSTELFGENFNDRVK